MDTEYNVELNIDLGDLENNAKDLAGTIMPIEELKKIGLSIFQKRYKI